MELVAEFGAKSRSGVFWLVDVLKMTFLALCLRLHFFHAQSSPLFGICSDLGSEKDLISLLYLLTSARLILAEIPKMSQKRRKLHKPQTER